jgi:hypothetical protein
MGSKGAVAAGDGPGGRTGAVPDDGIVTRRQKGMIRETL